MKTTKLRKNAFTAETQRTQRGMIFFATDNVSPKNWTGHKINAKEIRCGI